MNKDLWLKRVRNYAGFLGMILPILSLLGAIIYSFNHELPSNFWRTLSISATYYINPSLVGVLTTASVILMCYDGYSKLDNLVTTLSGVFGIGIVLFPCNCSVSGDFVGYFQLSVKLSNMIHCTCAVIFFCLLAYNSLFLFTLCESDTKQKKIRNIIYRVCGIGMLCSMVLMPLPIYFFAKTFIVEMLALFFFGISWLVKGQALGILADK
jgi:hypothetical protein